MASKLSSVIRRIFLSSIAGIAANSNSVANSVAESEVAFKSADSVESNAFRKLDLTPKLLLKRSNNDGWTFTSHRSHRSHQSHRSHYSSQGTGHISHFSHYSSSTGGGYSPNVGSGSPNTGSNLPSRSSNSSYTLGSRNLTLGKSGSDVTELVNILIRKGYITLNNGSSYATGVYEYDITVRDAVKSFQRACGITADGICGPLTIFYLKK